MIDKELQANLHKRYNPDNSPLRLHQLKLLELLKYFDAFCKKNEIQYWLSSGTCLGAVRHKGFIPWDDDVDVEMLLDDYKKLIRQWKDTEDYALQTWKSDPCYQLAFAKMRDKHSHVYDSLYELNGCFIDIFCLERTNKYVLQIANGLRNRFVGNLYLRMKKAHKGSFKFALYFRLFIFFKWLFSLLVPLFRFVTKPFRKNLRHTYGVGWEDKIRKEQDIFPLQYMTFEGYIFPVPGNYNNYLTRIYGNYMCIPDETNIQSFHVKYF